MPAMTIDLGHIDWIALGAIATFLLALGTVWLGWQTRDVSLKTGALAETTGEEMDLLRKQADAMRDLADLTKQETEELREARFAEFLPVLRWQEPGVALGGQAPRWTMNVTVLLTNEGPGPARIRAAQVTTDTAEDFLMPGLTVPSTLPPGERISVACRRETTALDRRERVLTISLRYGDMLGEFEYQTTARLRATFEEHRYGVGFVDSDERSALERRLPRTKT